MTAKPLVRVFFIITALICIIYYPAVFGGRTLLNTRLLVSVFNPWMSQKFPGWEQGIPNKAVGMDDLGIHYPQRVYTTNALKDFRIPFWNPHSFSGNYHAGLSETNVFYPLFLLFLTIPQLTAWSILIMIQPLIASVGMYLFVRRITESNKAALIAGLAFGFSPLVLVRASEGLSVGHTLVWFPWTFWSIEKFRQDKKPWHLTYLLLFLSLPVLAGWLQYVFYAYISALAYGFLVSRNDKPPVRALMFLPFITAPLVTAFHIIPFLQAFFDSARSSQAETTLTAHLMPLNHLLTFLSPDFFGSPATLNFFGTSEYKEAILSNGIIPTILMLCGLVMTKTSKHIRFFTGAIFISLLLGIRNPLSEFVLRANIPMVSTFVPNRVFVVAVFSGAVLAGYGIDYLLSDRKRLEKLIIPAVIAVCLSIILAILYAGAKSSTATFGINPIHSTIPLRQTVMSFGISILFLSVLSVLGKRTRLMFFGILIVMILPVVLFARKFIPFSEKEFAYPKHPILEQSATYMTDLRLLTVGSGYIRPNISLAFGIPSPEGGGSLYPKRYAELIHFVTEGKRGNLNRVEARLEYPASILASSSGRLQTFMAISGTRFVAAKNTDLTGIAVDKAFLDIWSDGSWTLFSNEKAWPVAFLTGSYAVTPPDRDLEEMFSYTPHPQIILNHSISFPPHNATGSARIVSKTGNEMVFETVSDQPSLLYVAENFSPYFLGFVDGVKTPILAANHAFRAMEIPAGIHTVVMKYDTTPFIYALAISISSCTVFLFVLYRLDRKKLISPEDNS